VSFITAFLKILKTSATFLTNSFRENPSNRIIELFRENYYQNLKLSINHPHKTKAPIILIKLSLILMKQN